VAPVQVCDISMLQVSIDLLSWDFSVMTVDDSNISGSPKVSFTSLCFTMTMLLLLPLH